MAAALHTLRTDVPVISAKIARQIGTYACVSMALIEMSPAALGGSDAFDPEPSTRGFDHRRDVLLVRGHDDLVTPSDSTFSNGHVDDTVVSASAGQLAHPARLIGTHRFDLTRVQ